MPFELPFDPPVVVLIDVRCGGAATADALMRIMGENTSHRPSGAAIYVGIDDDKVLTYAQWEDSDRAHGWLASHRDAVNEAGPAGLWSARLFRLASTANCGPIDLTSDQAVIAHTGLFAMHSAESLAPFLALAQSAAEIAVANASALLTANFHASLDGERAINLGFWNNIEGFRSLAANPPFANHYWEGLADNEPGLYQRVWVTARDTLTSA